MRITDYFFFGSIFIILGLALILERFTKPGLPYAEIWIGFLIITVVIPKIVFPNTKYVHWLEKKRHIKTTEED